MVETLNNAGGNKEMYWIYDDEDLCWSPGEVVEMRGKEIVVKCTISGNAYEIEKDDAIVVHPSCLNGVSDLLELGDFNEGALLHTIRERHSRQQIYTSIGSPILISVNPFQRLDIFTTSIAQKYRDFAKANRSGAVQNDQRPDPHLFMVAEDSYQDLLIDRANQSVIITGESGAGKTEATKIILSYLAKASQGFSGPEQDLLYKKPTAISDFQDQQFLGQSKEKPSIEKQVLDSNPLLEAFGNAKTFKNNNSSRFGKFIQVNFDPTGHLHSANIVNYLLEKSRIIYQFGIERNFHIFYQVLRSFQVPRVEQAPLMRKFLAKYRLDVLENYHYVNQSDVSTIDDVDDVAEFEMTLQCMRNVHFSDSEIAQTIDAVVAILNIGNIEFGYVNEEQPGPSAESETLCRDAARHLQIDLEGLILAMTRKRQKIGGETIETPLTIDQAYQARDTLSKHLYGSLFSWIVQKINAAISVQPQESTKMASKKTKLMFIGLLDIFGFEIFAKNSFEQLCINYANEKLQQLFNQHMFTLEQQEYINEGIEWSSIQFKDNQHTIDLIEDPRQISLFRLLDEQFMLAAQGSDKNFHEKIKSQLAYARSLKKPAKMGAEQFIICHYAGEVTYDIEGFVEKNKDSVSNLLLEILANSKQAIIKSIYQPLYQTQTNSAAGSSLKGNSLSNQFRAQLAQLVITLRKSSPRYIRCIKPNSRFSPTEFDSIDVLKQLRCAGMLEAIRIRKAGYSIRIFFNEFKRRYRPCLKAQASSFDNRLRDGCEAILKLLLAAKPTMKGKFQIGNTKVFLKEETRSALEQLLNTAVLDQVIVIQAAIRGTQARIIAKKMKQAKQKIMKFIYSRILRHRLRQVFKAKIENILQDVSRIQKGWRRVKLQRKLIAEVNRRIAFKARERYQKEQERLKLEEQKRIEEAKASQQLVDSSKENNLQQQDQHPSTEISLQDNRSPTSNALRSVKSTDSNNLGQNQSNRRFATNLSRIEATFTQQADLEKLKDLEADLECERLRTKSLEAQLSEARSVNADKDRKIRELNALLVESRKNPGGSTATTNNSSEQKDEMMSFTSGDLSVLRHIPLNSGDNQRHLFTPDGQFNDDLDDRDDLIEQLKTQVELMENEKSNLKSQIQTLQEDNDSLNQKNRKWISKLDEEIDRNKGKVSELTSQIKSLQDENYKLEVTARLDTTIQQNEEEMERLRSQLQDRQDLADQLESRLYSIQEEHQVHVGELKKDNRALNLKITGLETEIQERNREIEQIQEQLIELQMDHQIGKEAQEQSIMDDLERNQEVKSLKKLLERQQAQEKKLTDENEWLRAQLNENKAKNKDLIAENDELQDKLIEIKSAQVYNSHLEEGQKSPNNPNQESSHLQDFERNKMQEAIDEMSNRQRSMREENKRLDAENNFFHQSTTVFINLKKVMEIEKQLCYQLATLASEKIDVAQKGLGIQDEEEMEEYAQHKLKLESGIGKCQDNVEKLEKKLKKILSKVKSVQKVDSQGKPKDILQQTGTFGNQTNVSLNLTMPISAGDTTNQSLSTSQAQL